jgi:DNA polymerase-3 subunit epsilon
VSLWRLLPGALRRRRLARVAPPGPLRDFYAVPPPPNRTDWRAVEFVALDFEATGTDARTDDIVSAGWVVLRGGAIQLATARHRLVRTARPMPEHSAVVHAITDDEVAAGEPLEQVLTELLADLTGRVLIAHYSPAELGLLDAACRRHFGGPLRIPVVDTFELARRRLAREGKEPVPGDLRLDALRARIGLPEHALHDALGDAIATAELFLAQAEHLGGPDGVPLGSLRLRGLR